jgi:hypothetical protein
LPRGAGTKKSAAGKAALNPPKEEGGGDKTLELQGLEPDPLRTVRIIVAAMLRCKKIVVRRRINVFMGTSTEVMVSER